MYALKAKQRRPCPRGADAFVELILNAERRSRHPAHHRADRGREAIVAISDAIVAAYCKHINHEVWSRRSFFQIGHAYDYSNVVNFWLRNYEHPHQAKARLLPGPLRPRLHPHHQELPARPDSADYLGDPLTSASWADGLATGRLLQELLGAIERLDCARAVALTESYLGRTNQRKPLMRVLALAAAKFQNDPHIQRNGATSVEEWELTTARGQRDNILRAWTKYVSGGAKRTTALDCVQQYEQIMGVGSEQTAVARAASQGVELGVMGYVSAREAAALSDD